MTKNPRNLNGLKAERLAKTANVLCGQRGLKARIEQVGAWTAPSYWEEDTRTIVMNRSIWAKRDAVVQYLNEKSCFYHELGHVRYTRFTDARKECSRQAHDVKLYLDVSNILEDGRIETELRNDFPGMRAYLDYVGAEFAKVSASSRLMALAYRVRFGKYLDHAAYWAPFEANIKAALAGNSKTVWQESLVIVNALVPKPKASQMTGTTSREATCHAPQDPDQARNDDSTPEPGQGAPSVGNDAPDQDDDSKEAEPGAGSGQGTTRWVGDQVEPEDDSAEAGDGEPKDDVEEAGEGAEDGPQGDDEAEGTQPTTPEPDAAPGQPEPAKAEEGTGGMKSDEQGTGAGKDTAPKTPDEDVMKDEDRAALIKSIQDSARDLVTEDLQDELAEMTVELASVPVEHQNLKDSKEHDLAERLAAILLSIKVEAHRTKWTATSRHGSLDSRRITGLVTGDGFLRQRQSASGFKFACAIAIDASGSMNGEPIALTLKAARAINAALERTQVQSRCIIFDDEAAVLSNVPDGKEDAEERTGMYFGGGTETYKAMAEAAAWLENQSVRKLVLILTDGMPSSEGLADQKARLEAMGAYVVSIQLGMGPEYAVDYQGTIDLYAHRAEWVPELEGLERALEDVVGDFASNY